MNPSKEVLLPALVGAIHRPHRNLTLPMRPALQGLYSMFPNGLTGAGLLLLRLACGAFAIAGGMTRILSGPHIPILILQSIELAAALLLLVGLWTPVAGILIVLVELCLACSGTSSIENSVLLAALSAALAVLGPGCHSMDAKHYGRRRLQAGKHM